jgi:hypothetical protein
MARRGLIELDQSFSVARKSGAGYPALFLSVGRKFEFFVTLICIVQAIVAPGDTLVFDPADAGGLIWHQNEVKRRAFA